MKRTWVLGGSAALLGGVAQAGVDCERAAVDAFVTFQENAIGDMVEGTHAASIAAVEQGCMGLADCSSTTCDRGRLAELVSTLRTELAVSYAGSEELVPSQFLTSLRCPTTQVTVPAQVIRGWTVRIDALIRASELPSCAFPVVGDRWVGPWSGYVAHWVPPTGPDGTTLGSPETEIGRDSDEALHEVVLTRGYWVGEVEVTQALWGRLMGAGWLPRNPEVGGVSLLGGSLPVHSVTLCEAVSFANAMSLEDGLTPAYAGTSDCVSVTWSASSNGWRLPTEAEWEWASRGGVEGGLYATESGGAEALCEFANVGAKIAGFDVEARALEYNPGLVAVPLDRELEISVADLREFVPQWNSELREFEDQLSGFDGAARRGRGSGLACVTMALDAVKSLERVASASSSAMELAIGAGDQTGASFEGMKVAIAWKRGDDIFSAALHCAMGEGIRREPLRDPPATARSEWEPDFACDSAYQALMPVGTKNGNGYRLKDMTGNVREWAWDVYSPARALGLDPGGAVRSGVDGLPVSRGGSWNDHPRFVRVADRANVDDPGFDDPGFGWSRRSPYVGLRLVRFEP